MTPKEKAEELVEKFIPHTLVFDEGAGWLEDKDEAKQCALIAVDTVMEALTSLPYGLDYLQQIDYYEGVKQEIEKL